MWMSSFRKNKEKYEKNTNKFSKIVQIDKNRLKIDEYQSGAKQNLIYLKKSKFYQNKIHDEFVAK